MTSIIVIVVVWTILSVVIGEYAERKGYNALLFTLIPFSLSPPVGLVIVLLLEDKRAPAAAGPSSTAPSRAGELERLAGLRERGALTDEEFAREKQRLFGEAS